MPSRLKIFSRRSWAKTSKRAASSSRTTPSKSSTWIFKFRRMPEAYELVHGTVQIDEGTVWFCCGPELCEPPRRCHEMGDPDNPHLVQDNRMGDCWSSAMI